jgi:cell division protein FtsZ
LGILTVGIVTTPFAYEGKKRQQQAEEGIRALRQHVDTLLVISNDKLRHQFGNLKMREAFEKADNVLATAAKCITDVINSTGQINVDFADVCTVMRNGGVAFLGSAMASGENRAHVAIEEALNSPLLNDSDIRGAKWILININSAHGPHEFTVDEVEVIQQYLLEQAGPNTDVILGMGYDETLGDNIGITLIATGFEQKDPFQKSAPKTTVAENKEEEKIVMVLGQPEETVVASAPVIAEPVVEPVQVQSPVEEIKPTIIEPVVIEEPVILSEHLIPTLIEETPEEVVTPAPIVEEPITIHFELQAEETAPIAEVDAAFIAPAQSSVDLTAQAAVNSGGYLARPANIYADNNAKPAMPAVAEVKTPAVAVVQPAEIPVSTVSSIPSPTSTPRPAPVVEEQEELLELQMQLVEKDELPEEIPAPVQVTPNLFIDSLPTDQVDEEEDQQRRAAERLHKLRNLSFNVNSADPNNEFETVPAYIRRNMELYNSSTQIESFYSNTEVKADDNSLGKLSDFNKFLDGKKPD